MVAAAEFTGICPRCGGDRSSQVVKPERFACLLLRLALLREFKQAVAG